MEWYYIVAIVLASLILCLCIFLSLFVGYPKKTSNGTWEKDYEYYLKYKDKLEPFIFKGYDGYELHGCLLKCEIPSNKYVIISHGYTAYKECSIKYADLYLKLGFNAIVYDNRGHGENNRKISCTLGKRESKDLVCLINDTYNKYGKDIYLGLHGESMGSGIEITSLKYKPDVKFVVNDCGYGSLKNVLRFCLTNQFHLPGFLVEIASLFSKIFAGYFYGEVKPIKSLKDNQVPICFVTSDEDYIVPANESILMSRETKGYKEVHVFTNAKHACSYWKDTPRYENMVKNFLDKIK